MGHSSPSELLQQNYSIFKLILSKNTLYLKNVVHIWSEKKIDVISFSFKFICILKYLKAQILKNVFVELIKQFP